MKPTFFNRGLPRPKTLQEWHDRGVAWRKYWEEHYAPNWRHDGYYYFPKVSPRTNPVVVHESGQAIGK